MTPAALDGRYSSQDARARLLSTLAPAPFTIDDVPFAAVEGFRPGLKHSDRYVLGGPLRRVRGNNLRDRSPMANVAADIAGSQVATLVRQGGRSTGWNASPLPPTRRRSTD